MAAFRALFIICLLLGFAAGPGASPAQARSSYFEMTETESGNLRPFPKWTGVISRYAQQRRVPDSECGRVRFHPCSPIREWRALIEEARKKPYLEQLDVVNDWANGHPYIIDQLNWGVEDYWETPYEFMTVNGDCEDYAIAKYYTLRAVGVPAERLRVIIVQDFNLGGIIHAILGAYDGDEMLILDNQNPSVVPALHIYHYKPIYGVNEIAWWRYHPESDM